VAAIDGAGRGWRVIPTRLSPLGVRVSESSDGPPPLPAAPEMQ
jgi:hypothetical protein